MAVVCRSRETIEGDGDETFLDQVLEELLIGLIDEFLGDQDLPEIALLNEILKFCLY